VVAAILSGVRAMIAQPCAQSCWRAQSRPPSSAAVPAAWQAMADIWYRGFSRIRSPGTIGPSTRDSSYGRIGAFINLVDQPNDPTKVNQNSEHPALGSLSRSRRETIPGVMERSRKRQSPVPLGKSGVLKTRLFLAFLKNVDVCSLVSLKLWRHLPTRIDPLHVGKLVCNPLVAIYACRFAG
jgi:hypothetical protein